MDLPAIKTATNSDEAAVFDALSLAFCADPVMRWLYPHPSKFLKHFPELMKHFGDKAFPNTSAHYVDGFVGAALWLPPGVAFDGEAIASLLQRTVAEEQHADLFDVFNQMPEYHPHEPHWYLAAIGIDPSRQNQGQGGALASQFFDLRKSVSPGYRPIQKLMLAVLGDGIEYFLGKGCDHAHAVSRRGRLRSEAGKWIFDEVAAGPFSFNWICDGLEIGQSYLRAGITRVFEAVEALPH